MERFCSYWFAWVHFTHIKSQKNGNKTTTTSPSYLGTWGRRIAGVQEFEASLGDIARPCYKLKQKPGSKKSNSESHALKTDSSGILGRLQHTPNVMIPFFRTRMMLGEQDAQSLLHQDTGQAALWCSFCNLSAQEWGEHNQQTFHNTMYQNFTQAILLTSPKESLEGHIKQWVLSRDCSESVTSECPKQKTGVQIPVQPLYCHVTMGNFLSISAPVS